MSLGETNAMANISPQTRSQREKFAGSDTGILGANRTSHQIFADRLEIDEASGVVSIEDESINEKAQSELTSLYVDGASGNPDFPLDHTGEDYNYTRTLAMLDSAPDQSDRPSRLGPNLIPPSIDEEGEVSTAISQNTASSPVTGRGFGVNLDRHNPGEGSTLGSYLNRRRNDDGDIVVKKGEFVNDASGEYDWEN